MEHPITVQSLAFALGERRQTVEEAHASGRLLSPPSALREAGFAHHHLCAAESDAYDLARRAVAGVEDLGDVDAIIYATCLPQNGSVGSPARFAESRDVKHLMDFP